MNIEQLNLAIAKTQDAQSRAELRAMRRAFEKVVEFNATFAQRIEASRQARGDQPVNANHARTLEIPGCDHAAMQQERRQTEDMKLFERADTIIRVLHDGLASDIQFWENALKHFHPGELPLGREYIAAKRRLMEKMSHFLAEHG